MAFDLHVSLQLVFSTKSCGVSTQIGSAILSFETEDSKLCRRLRQHTQAAKGIRS